MAKCKGCGVELLDGTVFCPYCGAQVLNNEENQVEVVNEVKEGNEINNDGNFNTTQLKKESGASKVFAIIGMVFGILVLVFNGLSLMNIGNAPLLAAYLAAFALEFSVPGMIFSIIGKKSYSNHGKAVFGFVANLVSLILSFILLFIAVFAFIEQGGSTDDIYGGFYF